MEEQEVFRKRIESYLNKQLSLSKLWHKRMFFFLVGQSFFSFLMLVTLFFFSSASYYLFFVMTLISGLCFDYCRRRGKSHLKNIDEVMAKLGIEQ